MNRVSKWYLILMSAAFMVCIGHAWLFPGILYKWGIGAFLIYVAVAYVLAFGAIAAVTSAQLTRMDAATLYREELNLNWLGSLFMVVNLLVISFVSIVAGRFLVALAFPTKFMASPTGSLLAGLISIVILSVIMYGGRVRSWDSMVTLYLIFVGAAILTAVILGWGVHNKVIAGREISMNVVLHHVFSLKMISWPMFTKLVRISVYMLGIGFGFWLVVGVLLPDDFDPKTIILGSTTLSILTAFVIGVLGNIILAINPHAPTSILMTIGVIPEVLKKLGLGWVAVIFGVGMFAGAFMRIIGFGEVTESVYEDLRNINRNDAVTEIIALASILTIIVAFTVNYNSILIVKLAITALLPLMAILEMWPAVIGKEYVPQETVWASRIIAIVLALVSAYYLRAVIVQNWTAFSILVGAIVAGWVIYKFRIEE